MHNQSPIIKYTSSASKLNSLIALSKLNLKNTSMASHSPNSSITTMLFICTILVSLHAFSAYGFEFHAGGTKGWVIPPANDSKIYNDWASENRFQPGDTLRFKYKKGDSVMEVTEAEYKQCNSTQPKFFSNTGNTVYKLNKSGLFYFISGVSRHCVGGQRMIVKVMAIDDSPSPSRGGGGSKSAGSRAAVISLTVSKLVIAQFALFYAASVLL